MEQVQKLVGGEEKQPMSPGKSFKKHGCSEKSQEEGGAREGDVG